MANNHFERSDYMECRLIWSNNARYVSRNSWVEIVWILDCICSMLTSSHCFTLRWQLQQPRLFATTHCEHDQRAYTVRTEFARFCFYWRRIIVTIVCTRMVLLFCTTCSMCLRKQVEIEYNHWMQFVDENEIIQWHHKYTHHA